MPELEEWLASHGLNINPILDGKIKRFPVEGDESDEASGWYVGSHDDAVTLTVGNWRTDQKDYFRAGGFKNGDLDDWNKKTESRRKEYEEDKKRIQEETAKEAEAVWKNAKECKGHEYFTRKGVDITGLGIRQSGGVALIPMRCSEGRLWGLQRIYPDGSKRFLKGQRRTGLFFEIPDGPSMDALIVEGFATGLSVFQATGIKTYVAFDAGSLKEIATIVRNRYRPSPQVHHRIIIAGDDDRWGKENKGRISASDAAKEVGGIAVFPEFKFGPGPGESSSPTDWNDLHQLEGLGEIKRQIEEKISGLDKRNQHEVPEKETENGRSVPDPISSSEPGGSEEPAKAKNSKKEYINYLGHSGEIYFYTTSSNKQIVKLSRGSHKMLGLADLMPYQYWHDRFPHTDAKGVQKGVDWEWAAIDTMEKCRAVGIFNPEKIRGSGCWSDDDKLVIHLGNEIIKDKESFEIGEFNSRYIYELAKELPEPPPDKLLNADCLKIIDAVNCLKWKHKDDAMYFLGWLAISRISGALNWRPHIWLTGPSGSGKSTVLEMIVKKIIGDWGLSVIGASSEAGIRQAIGKDSRPVIFDEAETTNEKTGRKIQAILELIRQASSSTDSKIMKGTADQSGLQFKINCLFLLSSIRVNLTEEADKNRFTVCELERNNPEDWPLIQEKIAAIGDDFGDKLFSRSIHCFDFILKNKEKLASSIAKKHNQRIGQQYGTLLAGYLSMVTAEEVSQEAIDKIVSGLYISDKNVLEIEEDEMECLNWALNHKINVPDSNGDRTEESISDLINKAVQEVPVSVSHYRRLLQTYGLKVLDDAASICVAKHHSELWKIFDGTKWGHGMWGRALKRINGSERFRTRFSSGNPIWCVKIPLTMCGDPKN